MHGVTSCAGGSEEARTAVARLRLRAYLRALLGGAPRHRTRSRGGEEKRNETPSFLLLSLSPGALSGNNAVSKKFKRGKRGLWLVQEYTTDTLTNCGDN